MSTTTTQTRESEATILARVLSNEPGQLPPEVARYVVDLDFSDRDKARMHDLALRNQKGALSPAEKEELFAFVEVGDLLAVLQAKARRTLGIKPKKHTTF